MQAENQTVSSYMSKTPLTDTSNLACRDRTLRKSKNFQQTPVTKLKGEALAYQKEDQTLNNGGYQKGHRCHIQPTTPPLEVQSTKRT